MKRNAIICAAVLSLTAGSVSYAANQGAYLGLGLGATKAKVDVMNQYKNYVESLNGKVTDHNVSLSGRAFGGYNFNEFFGLEAGYNAYGTTKQTAKVPAFNYTGNAKYKSSSVDLRAKAYLPVQDNNANVYAIAGIAYATQEVTGSESMSGVTINKTEKTTSHRYRPVYGVGANFNVNPQVTTALEITRQQGFGNTKTNIKAMPNVDTVALTVAYNFA